MDLNNLNWDAIRIGQRRDRIKSKKAENRGKPRLRSSDVVLTTDFDYTAFNGGGDSGQLLLATDKLDAGRQYVVKHEMTDCACNEFVYAKLLNAMGYHVPETKLFKLAQGEDRGCFLTEYIIGSRLLKVVDASPSYRTIRERAVNWKEYFSFYGFYAMTGECDGMETPLADDALIYRIDTTAAFPISNFDLEMAGIKRTFQGISADELIHSELLKRIQGSVMPFSTCDFCFDLCQKEDAEAFKAPFLEPFARIQEVSSDSIDDFLNTLCYFYPDSIGDFFRRYLDVLKEQALEYLKTKR